MATVPTVPTFTAGTVATAATLNQLGSAVSFLLQPPRSVIQQTNVAPVSGGQSIPATTATAIIWTTTAVNSDSGWNSSNNTQYTAQTPGAYFRITTGTNNPGGAGLTTSFGSSRLANVTSATGVNYTAIGTSMITPYMYVLDYVELIAYSSHAETTGFTDGGSYLTVTLVSV